MLPTTSESLEFVALGFAVCAIGLAILRNWRTGFYFFLVWMLFEDMARKYMGNNLALFFGKDILLLLVYISFFRDVRLGRAKTFRPPFMLFLSLFFWLGLLEVFNQNFAQHLVRALRDEDILLLHPVDVCGLRADSDR